MALPTDFEFEPQNYARQATRERQGRMPKDALCTMIALPQMV